MGKAAGNAFLKHWLFLLVMLAVLFVVTIWNGLFPSADDENSDEPPVKQRRRNP